MRYIWSLVFVLLIGLFVGSVSAPRAVRANQDSARVFTGSNTAQAPRTAALRNAQSGLSPSPTPIVVDANERGLTLEWTLPAFRLSQLEVDGEVYSQLQISSLIASSPPGFPELPQYSRFIGLPPTGQAELRVVEIEREIVSLPHRPIPAPVPQAIHLLPAEIDPQAMAGGGPTVRIPEPAIYTTDTFYPATVASLGSARQIRNQRIVSLTINPLRVNPVTMQLEVIRRLGLEIVFTEPAALAVTTQQARPNDGSTQAIAAALLNPAATQWSRPAVNSVRPGVDAASAGNAIKVLVSEAGLYALTYGDLQNAGVPVNTVDPKTFKLSRGYPRQEVAMLEQGNGDANFEPGERLLFYAEPVFSRFVDHDVYFLSYGGSSTGLRMGSRAGSPTGATGTAWRAATAETNQFYDPLYAGRDGDRWYWSKLATPDKTNGTYSIRIEAPLTSGPAATLTLWLQGYTAGSQNPDHLLQISFNGTSLGTVNWDGKTAYTANLGVPAPLLKEGQNQVALTLPGLPGVMAEGMWLDAIRLRYPTGRAASGQLRLEGEAGQKRYTLTGWTGNLAVYDITAAAIPLRVTGYTLAGGTLTVGDASSSPAAYLVVPDHQIKTPLALQTAKVLNDPPNGADYIIITPPGLAGAVAPLATHRAARGLRVATVDVEAIYDVYGSGRMDPEAIKSFLAHAYATWQPPAPLYVLLVGDGSYDFKNFSGYNPQTVIPPYLVQVDPWWGETAADNRLVTLAGNDTLPELFIGRLPVNTPAEATTLINKIIQYETIPPAGPWQRTALFVSDNPDSAADFHAASDKGFDGLAGSLRGRRFYYSKTGGSQPYFYSNVAALRSDFLNAFNEGGSLVTFHGHSSWHQWAVESLFHIDQSGQFNNQNRLPVVLQMTCFTGFFHHPQYPTLDESWVRHSGGGAIAAWGGTGLGVGTGHTILQQGFYRAVMTQGETILGAAALAGKMELLAAGIYQDLLDTYTLLGDPALTMASVYKPDVAISQQLVGHGHRPGDPVTFTITVRNIGIGQATGVRVTSLLPAAILSPGWSASMSGVTETGSTFVWNLPDMAPTSSITLTISGTLDPTLPAEFSMINTASAASRGAEMDQSNNTSTLIIGGSRAYLPFIGR